MKFERNREGKYGIRSIPLHRDNPASFDVMTRGIAGSQVTLYGEWSKM